MELVAIETNLGRYAKIHPTKAILKEQLPSDLSYICISFLVNKKVLEIQVDGDKIKRDIEHYLQSITLAYFVGGQHI